MDVNVNENDYEFFELSKIQKREDIKSFKIIEQLIDDNLQCAVVEINGIEIEFNYYDDLGFLTYYHDSDTAFNDLKESIKNSIEIHKDN